MYFIYGKMGGAIQAVLGREVNRYLLYRLMNVALFFLTLLVLFAIILAVTVFQLVIQRYWVYYEAEAG